MPLSPAAGSVTFSVADYVDAPITTEPAGSDGICTATFDAPGGQDLWLVDRITVWSNSTAETTASVYVGSVGLAGLRDLTIVGNSDVADENQPIVVPTGQALIVEWTGVSLAALCHVNVSYRLVNRVRV